jgi:hypothetical protein
VTELANGRTLSPWQRCREIVKIGVAGLLLLLLSASQLVAGGAKVTEEQLQKVYPAYLEAKSNGFSAQALVKLYSLPGVPVAEAVKKLVDLKQERPDFCIPKEDSIAMEATRQSMNMRVLQELAVLTWGSVEVMDAGKQNGIRSDKDLMIFGVLDGKRVVSATEMKALYDKHFERIWGIKLEKLDMTIFDGDAKIYDWRKTNLSLAEFVERFKKGQAKLEQNPEAVREAGTWRQGAELRYATNSLVTMVKYHPEPDDPRVLPTIDKNQMREVPWENNETYHFEVIENAHVKEASERYKNWIQDIPYRNAMDASYEWWQRHNHTNDFVDRMKYFNRTVGDGVNALAREGWDVQYIFHLNELAKREPNLVRDYIEQLVEDVYSADVGPEKREHFRKVIELSARIEIDKMHDHTQPEASYLKPIAEVILKEPEFAGKGLKADDGEVVVAARQRFFDYQAEVMRYNLALTARRKLQWDLADPERDARLIAKYSAEGHDGLEELRKLQWETWRQVGRVFEGVGDPVLIGRIVAEAPETIRPRLQQLADLAGLRREWMNEEHEHAIKVLKKPDPAKVGTVEPEEVELIGKPISQAEFRMHQVDEILARQDTKLDKLKAIMETDAFSDDAIAGKLRSRALESLGIEEREVLKGMQVEFEKKFNGSRLLDNVITLGSVNSLLNVITVYQTTGDLDAVEQAVVWEVVSRAPVFSELTALKQSVLDANHEPLYWLYIAEKIPAAGEIKLVFDITKTALTIVYTHAMEPLKEDRLSQVYMGFIPAQAAGWSPLKPGWKERTEAASDSIYRFVPGKTFEEKRTNMFKFFNDRLEAKLQANGFKPTEQDYWEHYDRAAEPYLRKYVEDYFAAAGEWNDNTTVGLKAIGQQAELKARLADLLVHDWRQGQRNYDRIQLGQAKFEKSMADKGHMMKETIGVEKKLSAAEQLLAEQLQVDFAGALRRSAPPPQTMARLLRLAVSPPVVQDGQEASILVQLVGPAANEKAPDQPYKIEVRRPDKPPAAAKGTLTAEAVAGELAEDVVFVRPMLDAQKAKDTQAYFLVPLEYEVTVTGASGDVVARDTVMARLVGPADTSASIIPAAQLGRWTYADYDPKTKKETPFGWTFEVFKDGTVKPPGGTANVISYTDAEIKIAWANGPYKATITWDPRTAIGQILFSAAPADSPKNKNKGPYDISMRRTQ